MVQVRDAKIIAIAYGADRPFRKFGPHVRLGLDLSGGIVVSTIIAPSMLNADGSANGIELQLNTSYSAAQRAHFG